MNIERKLIEIKNYMISSETKLQENILNDISELNLRKDAIEHKYEVLKQDAIKKSRYEKEKIQKLYEQSRTLVEGIRRKLFKKQHHFVTLEEDEMIRNPEDVLAELEHEIGSFETTSLPYGIRQLLDSVSLLFNSNYGQEKVDKINMLYQSIVQLQENGELDKKLNDELSELDQVQLQKIYSIDRTITSIIEESVDGYIYTLRNMIFTI